MTWLPVVRVLVFHGATRHTSQEHDYEVIVHRLDRQGNEKVPKNSKIVKNGFFFVLPTFIDFCVCAHHFSSHTHEGPRLTRFYSAFLAKNENSVRNKLLLPFFPISATTPACR